MRIALAQLNPIVGDIAGNTALVLDAIRRAKRDQADVLVTSELALIGYPPRDLLLREGVVDACEQAVQQIAEHAGELHVIVGHPRRASGLHSGRFRNSASVCVNGKVIAVCDKQLLPGYDVFDEDRYFEPGGSSLVVKIQNRKVGVLICEDLWRAKDVNTQRRYSIEPVAECVAQGAELICALNASPFVIGKWRRHVRQLQQTAGEYRVPIVAVNQVGANDDLIFDGRSIAVNAEGLLLAALPGFQEAVRAVEVLAANDPPKHRVEWPSPEEELFASLVCGVKDYVHKTGHKKVLLGLSGGIDSAVVAAIAAAALGPENVRGVMMPSQYSSQGSIDDAIEVAKRLGLKQPDRIDINQSHQSMRETIEKSLNACVGVTDENIQARLRGVILMALSNASGALLLSTSNKSEMAVGYSTLYGDMCGAVAVIGDVLKTRIYTLANWINANYALCGFSQPPIPENSISKPPSAELRPNQTDQDSLPPYEILDQIVERYIERDQSESTIVAETGIDAALILKTVLMIDRAQYKRDQAPVVLKVSPRAFGRGRPMPIVMKQTAISLPSSHANNLSPADSGLHPPLSRVIPTLHPTPLSDL